MLAPIEAEPLLLLEAVGEGLEVVEEPRGRSLLRGVHISRLHASHASQALHANSGEVLMKVSFRSVPIDDMSVYTSVHICSGTIHPAIEENSKIAVSESSTSLCF